MVQFRHKAVRKTETCFSEALGRDWYGIGTKCKTFGRKASNASRNGLTVRILHLMNYSISLIKKWLSGKIFTLPDFAGTG
jgi:hypothetical protein